MRLRCHIRWFLVVYAVLAPTTAFAHEDFAHTHVLARTSVGTEQFQLQIGNADREATVHWKATNSLKVGASIAIKGVPFAPSYAFSTSGDGKRQDFRADTVLMGRWFARVNYQYYRGLHATDASEVPSNLRVASGLKVQHASLGLAYVDSPERFSLSAILSQSQRQETSGGSWLFDASMSYMYVDNGGDSLILESVQPRYADDGNLLNVRAFGLALGVGYGYTWVLLRRWFLSGVLVVGAGPQYRLSKNTYLERSIWQGASKIDFALSLGFNGDRWIAVLDARSSATSTHASSARLMVQVIAAKANVGVRF